MSNECWTPEVTYAVHREAEPTAAMAARTYGVLEKVVQRSVIEGQTETRMTGDRGGRRWQLGLPLIEFMLHREYHAQIC